MTATKIEGISNRQILAVLPGLLLAMLLAMLDNLVVGTAMPRIVGELNGLEHFSWVVTGYVLPMTVTTPLYGKLGDLYGRKRLFMIAIVVFLAGSALSGLAQTMNELIAFRAIQGAGAGGLIVSVIAIIGDLVPPRDRGKFQGYMAAAMGVATIGGPLLGGFVTDHWSWRWAFYINLPLGLLALVIIAMTLHIPRRKVGHRIDWIGSVLVTFGSSSLVLLLTWGGKEYAWISWQIIGLGVLGFLALLAFLFAETRAAEPVVPLKLFRNMNFSVSAVMGFIVGFVMFGAVTFLPMYQQTVQGASATNSGLLLIPMLVPMLILSPIAGQIVSRTGRYKVFPIIGGAFMAAGIFLFTRLDVDTTKFTASMYMVVVGIGMALLMQIVMLIPQNSVTQADMGVATSTVTFLRTIGASFGVAIAGAAFSGRIRDALGPQAGAGGGLGDNGAGIDPAKLAGIPANIKHGILVAISDGVQAVFWWTLPFAVLVFILAWAVKEVPLRTTIQPTEPE